MAGKNADGGEQGDQELFQIQEPWVSEWVGMPEYTQEEAAPFKTLQVHFETPRDLEIFAKLMEQSITENTRSIWFPEVEEHRAVFTRYADEP